MSKFILVEGDLTQGFTFHGPFDSRNEALEYEELKCTGFTLVHTLNEPDWGEPTEYPHRDGREEDSPSYRRDMIDAGRGHLLKP